MSELLRSLAIGAAIVPIVILPLSLLRSRSYLAYSTYRRTLWIDWSSYAVVCWSFAIVCALLLWIAERF